MRRAAAAALALAASLTPLGCGDYSEPAGPLRWDEEPTVITPEGLPGDRIATGSVRNSSLEPVTVKADELAVTAGSRELETDSTFLAGYGRGFVETARGYADPDDVPEFEQVRTGRLLKLEPGASAPLTVAWRGEESVDGVRYRRGFLPLP